MNELKTPNLGLNKIDRSSPSTTYFDLDKYLDQNWGKVDEGVGKVVEKAEETAAQVSSIQERLDTEKRRSVTLEPGLQVVHAERASAFKLEGLKGRTLVNLLGRDGGCEDLSKIGVYQSTLSLDSSNKAQGSNGLKMTISSGTSGIGYFTVALKAGKSYVAIAEVKNGNGSSVYINLAGVGAKGNPVTDTTRFNVTWTRYTPPADVTLNVDVGVVGTAVGQYGYADAVRLFEVSAVEYAALANMTPEQINAKYPYVDSVQPVRNPYVIRYGENILPPLYEWNTVGINPASIKGAYKSTYSVTNSQNAYYYLDLVLSGDVSYTYSAEHNGYLSVTDPIKNKVIVENTPNQSLTFTTTEALTVRIYFSNIYNTPRDGSYFFSNPMLTIGTTAKPFKPREDVMLALQTELYSNPLTDADADEVFEKDGQYFKLTKWKKRLIDSSLSYQLLASLTGMKEIYISGLTEVNAPVPQAIMSKHDGGLLTRLEASKTVPDLFGINITTGTLYMTIASADSGWGDSYTPTADEIKAYFMGWRMYTDGQDALLNTYNGTGTKKWVKIGYNVASGVPADAYSATIPTTKEYVNGSTSYQLVYQLSMPSVEPIMSEGQLTLIEGNNQVEVGTGIVLREKATPEINTVGDYYTINTAGGDAITSLNNKVDRFIGVFRDSKMDTKWADNTYMPFGHVRKVLPTANFDPSAKYTVTYLMLDKSPIASFVGSYATNEKALFIEMNENIQQMKQAVSVVEQADKLLIQQQSKRNVWGGL
ncbi:hypothetical protein [Paenibacillus taichungensis]|uniref:hypothetical protein n=1 Tax=Paenibacillus taichungensis TaxID=484184 RepID=UPI00287203D9|nr:hypothetical protein [Paenibacillus taichungensis]MDR9744110.1 hypothetical protein [Paenibacillus taichungensis]